MSKVENLGGGVYILKGANAVATVKPNRDAAKQTISKPVDYSTTPYSPWGDDNLFPQNVLTDLNANSIALRALEKRKNVHFGRGLIAYRDKDGEKNPVTDPEIVDFFRINRVNIQQLDLIGSLETFANAFVEMIPNKWGDKINKIFIKDPCYCRWEVMNENSMRIENMYYSANWDKYYQNEETAIIPTFDPAKMNMASGRYSDPKFIYPVFYKSFNKSYYHLAIWNGVRENSWMQLANKVPALKLAIMENQMMIKYHIEIPADYFQNRYPNPKYDDSYREKALQTKISELNDFLSNVENSGKALVTLKFWDKQMKQEYPGWTIDVIDNKLKDDAYLPDSQAANSEILFAIGIDPSLIGGQGVPGGKLGAGSGSDKREAFWMLNAEMGPYRTISTDWLYFVRDFNKWDPTIQFDYMVVDTSQTQDQHPTKINQNVDSNTKQ